MISMFDDNPLERIEIHRITMVFTGWKIGLAHNSQSHTFGGPIKQFPESTLVLLQDFAFPLTHRIDKTLLITRPLMIINTHDFEHEHLRWVHKVRWRITFAREIFPRGTIQYRFKDIFRVRIFRNESASPLAKTSTEPIQQTGFAIK